MACTVNELLTWLAENKIKFTDMIAVDEGGLTLVVYGPDAGLEERKNADTDSETCSAYFEIGGVNVDEDEGPCNRCDKGHAIYETEDGENLCEKCMDKIDTEEAVDPDAAHIPGCICVDCTEDKP